MNGILDSDRPVFTGRVLRRLAIVVGVLGALVTTGALIAGALVPEQPRLDAPIALDGEVWAIEQVGNAVVVGGNFTRIQTERDGPIIDQAGIYAYDIDSGILLDDFLPTLIANNGDAEIKALVPAADGRSVYIGGVFTAIDDHTDDRVRIRNRIAKLDVTTGRLDRDFARGGVDAKVLTLELVGTDLYVGGNFNRIYDTDIGRPPTEHIQSSLARFDAVTGGYDSSFRVVPDTSVARTGMLGVTNLSATPDGRWLVLSHRGRDLVDLNLNERFTRPGIAMLDLAAGGTVSEFRALTPTGADAYSASVCGGRGIFIRDLEVSPDGSYFALTHQGHDTGWVCDTAVRYPVSPTPSRPDWVSRIFDSVFSIGIDDDAIYVGGHFRYMVSPEAPSAYPGRQPNANGSVSPYEADPARDRSFRDDLVNPGHVYRAYQIGALNPETGRGIPSWNPGSDADKCVCVITVVDRGLLIGQDRGRVNGFNVGRAGFFDNSPAAGDTRCTVALDENNDPLVAWTDIGNVDEWRVARNGEFQTGTTTTSWIDSDPPFDTNVTYELRFNRNGIAQTDDCGTVRVDLVPITCVVDVVSDTELEIDWNDNEADRWTVRRNDVFVTSIEDQTRFVDTGLTPGTSYEYAVVSVRNGVSQDATCAGATPGRTLTCTVAVTGEEVTVAFNGSDFNRVSVQRDGGWQATLTDDETSWTQIVAPGTYAYTARGMVDGFASTADCGTATISPRGVVCSVSIEGNEATITFNGEDFNRTTIRRDGTWQATLVDGETSFTQTVPVGTFAYTVTGTANGLDATAECGTAEIAAQVLTCTTTVDGDDVLVSWNDVGAAEYQARRNDAWAATLTAGATSWVDQGAAAAGATYDIRYRFDGTTTTVECG